MQATARLVMIVLAVVLLTVFSSIVASCGPRTRGVVGDVVDCTTSNARGLIDQFGPVVDALLAGAVGGDGKVDWSPVKAAARNFGVDAGGCVLAATVKRALEPGPVDPSSPQVAPNVADPVELRAGFEALRVELLAGKRFKLPGGDL